MPLEEQVSSGKLGAMGQEESHKFGDESDDVKQLPLPFQQRFLLDENTANKQLEESLLGRDACVLTLADFSLLCASTSDQTVSEIGATQSAWIVTRDTKFVFDALKEGGTPHCIALVSSKSTESLLNAGNLSESLSGECSPVSAYSTTEAIEIVDLRSHKASAFTLPLPPDRMIQLFDLLEKRTRIDTHKLTEQWTCSPARARQIARRLSNSEWLITRKVGRSNRYYAGPTYLRVRNMLLRSPSE